MNDAEFQKLLNAEPPIVLKANPPWILLVISGLVLIAILATGFSAQPRWLAIFLLGGLCLCVVYFALDQILSPSKFILTIDRDGFSIKVASEEQTHQWKNVSEFTVRSTTWRGSTTDVYFRDISQNCPLTFKEVKNVGMCATFLDVNNKLLGAYGGMDFVQLARIMNHWRERALASK